MDNQEKERVRIVEQLPEYQFRLVDTKPGEAFNRARWVIYAGQFGTAVGVERDGTPVEFWWVCTYGLTLVYRSDCCRYFEFIPPTVHSSAGTMKIWVAPIVMPVSGKDGPGNLVVFSWTQIGGVYFCATPHPSFYRFSSDHERNDKAKNE